MMEEKRKRETKNEKSGLLLVVSSLIVTTLLILALVNNRYRSFFCAQLSTPTTTTQIQRQAILHYATSNTIPQLTRSEIKLPLNVLVSLAPCNFLVFGLGHDSLMWAALNTGGTTLFLEEDPSWVQTVSKNAPDLNAYAVNYRTHLSEADSLLISYSSEPYCMPNKTFLQGNSHCKLALHNLPHEVYDREWDVIMIDAPRGYFPAAPGRMAAIYSATIMARARKSYGPTHVFLHDVDRKVEKAYAEEFLCRQNLVESAGRLWHFEIPPADGMNGDRFCTESIL